MGGKPHKIGCERNSERRLNWLAQNKDAFAAAASLVSILGVLSIVVALWSFIGQQRETKRSRAFERTKLSLELMSQYYNDPEFDELRHRLWARKAGERTQANLLTRGEIRLLNYFEALALAVDQRVLDAHLVSRMLGSPLRQLAENPFLGPYVNNPKHSYEGIRELWATLGISVKTQPPTPA